MSSLTVLSLAAVLAVPAWPAFAGEPLPDDLPPALPAAPATEPIPMGRAPQPQRQIVEPALPGGAARRQEEKPRAAEEGRRIGNGRLRIRQDDAGPTRESPLRDPLLNPYAPRQP
ncbi:hypothetical protein I5J11_05235 [Pseudomonas aeruginosa]|nr:hypothetical protein [Pseudomonas aeruginosa]